MVDVNETPFYISMAAGPVATMVVVLIGVLINNNRISDLRSEMSARFNDMRELYRQQGLAQEANLRRVEDMLLGKFAELDTRLTRIESQLH